MRKENIKGTILAGASEERQFSRKPDRSGSSAAGVLREFRDELLMEWRVDR